MSISLQQPLKTIAGKRLAYLVGLEKAYADMGYGTKLNGRDCLLEIYPAGVPIPKTQEETIIEKWID
jgi:hypothetical protein